MAAVPIAGVVLAAGRSTRMGVNKLLLPFEGEHLVRRAVRVAIEGGLDPVLVVLGHDAAHVATALAGLPCLVVLNTRHALGLDTSLDAGLAAVHPDASAAMVLVADMPRVTPQMVRALVRRRHDARAAIVASRYGDVTAPPVLYDRALFGELRGATGDGRGREVLARHAAKVRFVEWPASDGQDVDAFADLEPTRGGGVR
jgi:molybdenum cofactor cytidylyltransferase